jgi:hypothetical protein
VARGRFSLIRLIPDSCAQADQPDESVRVMSLLQRMASESEVARLAAYLASPSLPQPTAQRYDEKGDLAHSFLIGSLTGARNFQSIRSAERI